MQNWLNLCYLCCSVFLFATRNYYWLSLICSVHVSDFVLHGLFFDFLKLATILCMFTNIISICGLCLIKKIHLLLHPSFLEFKAILLIYNLKICFLQTRDMKLVPKAMRALLKSRRTYRKKIQERLTAVSGKYTMTNAQLQCGLCREFFVQVHHINSDSIFWHGESVENRINV